MFIEPAKEVEAFSVVKRGKSFNYALRGVYVLVRTQHNMWIHMLAAVLTIVLGFVLHISEGEWLALILTITIVMLAEAFNTAIEFDIDLTSPEEHPFARDTKDVAAGAVLISSLAAIAVGLVIFLPKILTVFQS
jgi:diacylglycerol kinase (ATP)